MKYFIKTIGIRGEYLGISKNRFGRMFTSQMCFKTEQGNITDVRRNGIFIIYCIQEGIREFPRGGFIGIQLVLSEVYRHKRLFEPPWDWAVDIEPQIQVKSGEEITLAEVKGWEDKSEKLKNALKCNL